MHLRCNGKYVGMLLAFLVSLSQTSLALAATNGAAPVPSAVNDNDVSVPHSQMKTEKKDEQLNSPAKFRSGFLDLSKLNLSDDQKQKIKDTRLQNALQARQVHQEIRAKRVELRNLMFDPKASDQQIKMAGKQLNVLQGKLEDIAVSDFLYIRSILTTEQMQQLPELKPIISSTKQSGNQAVRDRSTRITPVN